MENDLFVWSLIWHAVADGFAQARVTEEILWMNGATWAQLWSGVLGAAAGAGVAMHVLRRTLREQTRIAAVNEKTQRELAAVALLEQSRMAQKQLTEQRLALEKQLNEQRASLRLQIQEQRRESALNREHAAIADVITIASESLHLAALSRTIDQPTLASFTSAVTRWQLESSDVPLCNELRKWGSAWWELIKLMEAPEQFNMSSDGATGLFIDISGDMLIFARDWPHATPTDRELKIQAMAESRSAIPTAEVSASSVAGQA